MDKSFLDEARRAARGVFAILVGDRGAPGYFIFTQGGLVGSFIGLVVVTALQLALVAGLLPGGVLPTLLQTAVLYAALLGGSVLYLRQIGRMDAFLPFVVTLNWSNAIMSLAVIVASMLGLTFVTIVIAVAAIVVSVNIARLIMTLKPMQVGILIIAQLVGIFAALIVVTLLFPPSAEQLAQISSAAGSRP